MDGGRFPDHMRPLGAGDFRNGATGRGSPSRNLTFNPENGEHSLQVVGPEPGVWFMLAHSTERKNLNFAEAVRSCNFTCRAVKLI